jgi:hypothetical protein
VSKRDGARPRWSMLSLALGLAGCQSILGIEELSEGPRLPGGGTGGQGGNAGDMGVGGSVGSQGGSQGGSADPGVGGGGGAAGVDTAADAGRDAAAEPITVEGHVVNFYRRPMPGVLVTIGEEQALTDENGGFTIAGVVPPYDVSFIASATQNDLSFRSYAYVYQGLTRPDPTLQVYYGLPERAGSLDLTVNNAAFTDPNQRLIFAFSSPDGYHSVSGISSAAPPSLSPAWRGPAATAGNAHGLLVLRSSSVTGAPPVAYEAYQTTPLALSAAADSSVSLDMSDDTLTQVTLTGSVDSAQVGTPRHLLFTRFTDGTVLPLLTQEASQATFSYLVPALAGTSLIVAASAGPPGYALAHADGVPAAAEQNVALTLPQPVSLSAPGNATDVGPGTRFSWSTLGQTAQVFVWHLESDILEGIYVVTARSELTYPSVPGFSMTLATPDDDIGFYWAVETHGDHASVDAAAGPDGIYDSFALELDIPTGVSRGATGYFTNSEIRTVNVVAQ